MTDPRPPELDPSRGAWAERRRLARALRELTRYAVISDAPEAVLREAADRAEATLETLRRARVRRYVETLRPGEHARTGEWVDRTALAGLSNPLAPPLRRRDDEEGDRVVAEADYSEAFEGAPGLVHGGHLAAAFDHVAALVAVRHARPILTAKMQVRYKKPTPLARTVRYEAELKQRVHTLLTVACRSISGDTVTAEAEVVFMHLPPEHMSSVLEAAGATGGPVDGTGAAFSGGRHDPNARPIGGGGLHRDDRPRAMAVGAGAES